MLHEMDETEEKTQNLLFAHRLKSKKIRFLLRKEPKRRALEVISPANSVEKASNKKKILKSTRELTPERNLSTVWKELHSESKPYVSYESSHWRDPLLLPTVWKSLH